MILHGSVGIMEDSRIIGKTCSLSSKCNKVIKEKFKISGDSNCAFNYLTLQINQNGDETKINQKEYINSLTPVEIN